MLARFFYAKNPQAQLHKAHSCAAAQVLSAQKAGTLKGLEGCTRPACQPSWLRAPSQQGQLRAAWPAQRAVKGGAR